MPAVPHAVFWAAALARLFCQLTLANGDFSWSELQGSSADNSHVAKGLAHQVSSSRRAVAALKRQLSPVQNDSSRRSSPSGKDATTANKPNCVVTSRTSVGPSTNSPHFIGQQGAETTTVIRCEVGFIFDVDGVLKTRDGQIDGARQALKTVETHKIPYLLLTNSGGRTDAEKADEVTKILDHNICPEKVQQCHAAVERD